MAGLPAKYMKKYPGNLKRAWAAYRSAGGKKKTGAKKRRRHHNAARKTGAPARKHGGEKMAHKRRSKGRKRAAVRRIARSGLRRVGAAMDTRPGKVLMASALATGGAVGSSFLINNVPKVKDFSASTKSGIQLMLGLAGIFLVRNRMVKAASAGSVVAGVMGAVKALTGLNPMAGPSDRMQLSEDQMRRLINGGGMSMPVRSVRMNAPAPVRMHGAFNNASASKGFGGIDT